jgi:hypothetical protein
VESFSDFWQKENLQKFTVCERGTVTVCEVGGFFGGICQINSTKKMISEYAVCIL